MKFRTIFPAIVLCGSVACPAATPDWWADRDVTSSADAENSALVNQGQLKHMAMAGYEELEENLPGGAGKELEDYLFGGYQNTSGILEQKGSPYSPVLNGHLKYLARLFLDRLAEEGYFRMNPGGGTTYPWSTLAPGSAEFQAPVTIGAVKYLFGFDLESDSDNDNVSDWWEVRLKREAGQTTRYYSDLSHLASADSDFTPPALVTLIGGDTPSMLPQTGSGNPIFTQVMECEVNDVADANFNNSKNTPLARFGKWVYWSYVSNSGGGIHIKVKQIELPETSSPVPNSGPYPSSSHLFTDSPGQPGHELHILAGDPVHSAPSVGVDREGYVHVTGGMHHNSWEYCVSTHPNDISDFKRIEESDSQTLPYSKATYTQFFNDRSGKLFVLFRARNVEGHWFNGATYGIFASYDEETKA